MFDREWLAAALAYVAFWLAVLAFIVCLILVWPR